MEPKHVVVVGGSVAGLGAGLALSQEGHRVTLLERDDTPLPAAPADALVEWDRRGAPQVFHSHAFLGRLYCMVRDRAPDLLAKLLEYGADELTFQRMARPVFGDIEPEPGDEDIVLLACTRTTFEWVLRRYILDSGRVEFREGVGVQGLVASQPATGVPTVTGVRLDSGETLAADLVLDATGRRSKISNWLEAIGVPRLREISEPCGITYSSRFYRVRPGAKPPLFEGGLGADLGYIKYGIFPGDAGVFSITLSTSPDDPPMRRVLRPDGFDAAARAIPAVAAWVDPDVSEPVTPVHSFSNLKNTRRFLVEDGEPVALGVLAVGDSGAHANPITGRGCSFAWITAYLVAEALRKHLDDLRGLALEVNDGIEREIAPWFKLQIDSDRDAIAVAEAVRAGRDPYASTGLDGEADAKAARRSLMRDGLRPAMRNHLFVMRAFMRAMNLLDPPADLLKRPELMKAVLEAYQERDTREVPVLGPGRQEMIDLLAA
ncbi:MAG: NAD-binding protein [Deltaproteobacteria bacterium]|nr:NAD-binding protein [Deltaproteobacteria bacterium]